MKKLKQGQTIYVLDRGLMYNPPRPKVITMFLHSHKTPLPEEGLVIEKWNVNYVNYAIRELRWEGVFNSRRKAHTALRKMKFTF